MPTSDDEYTSRGLKGRARVCRPRCGVAGRLAKGHKPRKLASAVPKPRAPGSHRNYGGWGEPCQHCHKSAINRPRRLCWVCYYKPGVKELYPITSKYAQRGHGNFSGQVPLADAPTKALPGTPEKVAVMEARAAAGRAIFHPLDARHALGETPAPDVLFPADPIEYEDAV